MKSYSTLLYSTLLLTVLSTFSTVIAQIVPNDPLYNQQDYIKIHKIDEVWGRSIGNYLQKITLLTAGEVKVSHEDLVDKAFQISGGGTGLYNEEATIVAGILVANTNNQKGIAAINWNASLESHDISEWDGVVALPNLSLAKMVGRIYDMRLSTSKAGVLGFYVNPPSNNNHFSPREIVKNLAYMKDFRNFFNSVSNSQVLQSFTEWNYGSLARVVTLIHDYMNAPLNPTLSQFYEAQKNIHAMHMNKFVTAPTEQYNGVLQSFPSVLSKQGTLTTVGSLSSDGLSRFEYSSYGMSSNNAIHPYVDIMAVGENVLTTTTRDIFSIGNSKYNMVTSNVAAASIVAGIGTLMMDYNQDLYPNDVKQILKKTAVRLNFNDPEYSIFTGHGRVDAKKAFDYMDERTIQHLTLTHSDFDIKKVASNVHTYILSSYWASILSTNYLADIYELKATINLPYNTTSDVWFDPIRTVAASQFINSVPSPYVKIEVNRFTYKATITAYVWKVTPMFDIQTKKWYPKDINDVKVELTIASKNGSWPTHILSTPAITVYGETGANPIIEWHPIQDATYYSVYREIVGSSIQSTLLIGSTNSTQFIDYDILLSNGLGQSDAVYAYYVVAHNQHVSSNPSNSYYVVGQELTGGPGLAFGSEILDDQESDSNIEIKVFPNPFNPVTNLNFKLYQESIVSATIVSVDGRIVKDLLKDKSMNQGDHNIQINLSNYSTGVYLVHLTVKDKKLGKQKVFIQKVSLLK